MCQRQILPPNANIYATYAVASINNDYCTKTMVTMAMMMQDGYDDNTIAKLQYTELAM